MWSMSTQTCRQFLLPRHFWAASARWPSVHGLFGTVQYHNIIPLRCVFTKNAVSATIEYYSHASKHRVVTKSTTGDHPHWIPEGCEVRSVVGNISHIIDMRQRRINMFFESGLCEVSEGGWVFSRGQLLLNILAARQWNWQYLTSNDQGSWW